MTAEFALDDFPTGLVVTTLEDREILFANQYFYQVSQQEPQSWRPYWFGIYCRVQNCHRKFCYAYAAASGLLRRNPVNP